MSKFYVPFLYSYKTRFKNLMKTLSWVFIYIVPSFMFFNHFSTLSFEITVYFYLIQCFIVYNFYEIGYIQNDTETIKNEKDPTMRLSLEERKYYENNKKLIYIFRIIIGVGLLIGFNLLSIKYKLNAFYFNFVPLLLLIAYQFHNRIRNKMNLLTLFSLFILRYLSYPITFLYSINFPEYLLGIFIYPVPAIILWSARNRFGILSSQIRNHVPFFRVIYYFSIVIISSVFYFLLEIEQFQIILNICFYFFIYRLLIFIFLRDKVKYKK